METKSMIEIEAGLTNFYNSPGGIEKTAAVMLQLLMKDLLHEGRIRQLFSMYQLGLGEEALFDADIAVGGMAISMEGLPERIEVKSDRVRIDTTPIAVKALVRWNESNYRKYDLLTRTQERAKASIQTQEDLKGFNLIDYSSTKYHSAVPTGQTYLTLEAIAEAISKMRRARVEPSKLVMNAERAQDLMLLKQSSTSGHSPLFMPETSEALKKSGKIGNIFGVTVLSVPDGEGTVRRTGPNTEVLTDVTLVDPKKVYLMGPQNYVGVMAVRTDLTIETMKDVNAMGDLFGLWEDIGFLVRYAKGILPITIS